MARYTYGRRTYGRGRYGGDTPGDIVPPDAGQGLPGLVANDRYQLIALTASGVNGSLPEMRYWYGAPPEWGDVLGARRREQLVVFYGTDELGAAPAGDIELPAIEIPKGEEATVSWVLVEVRPRPTLIGTFDGGLADDTEIGFSVLVEGFRQPGIESLMGTAQRESGIVTSDTLDWSILAADVDSSLWPNSFGVALPCRIATHVRSVRVRILNLRHVQVRSVEVHGTPFTSRLS